jgi:hypothetical protein
MVRYDPDRVPSREWFLLDEQERLLSVQRYHERAKVELPNATLHAIIHAVIEDQLASGVTPVVTAFERLMNEGLNRHDALHAIGSVLAEHMLNLMKGIQAPGEPNQPYYDGLTDLTASGWRQLTRS